MRNHLVGESGSVTEDIVVTLHHCHLQLGHFTPFCVDTGSVQVCIRTHTVFRKIFILKKQEAKW